MTQLGKYEIMEELGRGGFGAVYKARDVSLERDVALKVLHPQLTMDVSFLDRFRKEARALARVNHPNVVTIHEIGEVEGRVYIAMEYLPGGSLASRLTDGPLSLEETLKVTREICLGLQAGHTQGLIHRDVKPENILFNDRNEAVIADFGLAKAMQISSTTVASSYAGAVGTPYYRPPELWLEQPPTPATDIYSLACVVYEMLTGNKLFDGATPPGVMKKHFDPLELSLHLPDSLSEHLSEPLEKALAKDPSDRYTDMAAFQGALTEDVPEAEPKRVRKRKPLPARDDAGSTVDVLETTVEGREQEGTQQHKRLPKWVWWAGGVGMLGLVIVGLMIGIWGGRLPIGKKGPTLINKRDGSEMVFVPAGDFLMGNESEEADSDESPEHLIYLAGYWIYKYEVTNTQYRKCIEQGVCSGSLVYIPQDNSPTVRVDWYDAQAYCKWAGGRLPTEAEWEKAARGTDGRTYPWGEASPNCNLAQFSDCSGQTVPVGSFPEGISPYGALDMAGNAWEWVGDWYGENYYGKSPGENPIGPPDGSNRVIRGGSWVSNERSLRVSNRLRYNPDYSYYHIGFRCVSSP